MKRKHIEKIIKRDITSNTPDVTSRINLDDITIKKPESTPWYRVFTRPRFRLAAAGVAMVLVVLFVVLVSTGDPSDPLPSPRPIVFEAKEEVYSVSAFTAVMLLHQTPEESNDIGHTVNPMLLAYPLASDTSDLLLRDHMDTLNRYLNVLEPLVDNKNRMLFTHQASDRDGYDYMSIFQGFDMRNHPIEYTLYYNETIDGDTIVLDGLMMVGDTVYTLIGEIEIDEDDIDLEFYARKSGDENTYIKVIQTLDAEEQTFEYKHVVQGDTVFESSLSIEYDDDTIIIEFEYETQTDEVEFIMERRTSNGHDSIFIEYEIETPTREEEGIIIIDIVFDDVQETYIYRYQIIIDDVSYIIEKGRIIATDVGEVFASQATIIDAFIGRFEQMLPGADFFEEAPSPHPDYAKMMTLFIGVIDVDFTLSTITLHYNETLEDDTILVDGILILNGIEYALSGEFERDGDEREGELYTAGQMFSFSFSVDEDEQEYTYHLTFEDAGIDWEIEISIDWDEDVMELHYAMGDVAVEIELTQVGAHAFEGEYDIETAHVDESATFTYSLDSTTHIATYTLFIEDARRTLEIIRDTDE